MKFASLRRIGFLVVLALLLCLVLQGIATACPTCKAGLEGEEHSNIKQGYFWSILFMMSMPFVIFIGLGIYFYLAVRRARARAAIPAAAESAGEEEWAGGSESAELVEADEELVEV